jgi:hypothetical protein
MLANFMKDAVGRMLLRGGVWCAVCFALVAVLGFCGVVVMEAGDAAGGFTVAFYVGIAICIFGPFAVFRLQRGVRAALRTRKAEVECCLSEWGKPDEVRASVDQEMQDGAHLHIGELCPLMVTRSWVLQVSQYGLRMVEVDAVRGFRITFRPIPPFTSVGDYHITLRLDQHDPQVFLIDKDHHLDQFLSELISANRHLGGLFHEDYFQFPQGLTGRDIMSGSGRDQNPLSRSEVDTYIQERVDRMKNSNERTWELG